MAMKKNVQQQNADLSERIRDTALRWAFRCDWLPSLLLARGLDPGDGILVELSQIPGQGGDHFYGVWLTSTKRFWRFEIQTPLDGGELVVDVFEDATSEIVVSDHVPGTGRSFGALAIELLDEVGR